MKRHGTFFIGLGLLLAAPVMAQDANTKILHNDLYALGQAVSKDADTNAAAISGKLDILHTDLVALSAAIAKLSVVTSAPSSPPAPPVSAEYEVAGNLPTTPGQTVMAPAGTETTVFHISVPFNLTCAGMRQTMFDGQGGADAGHRLAWGKGMIHVGAGPMTITGCGFVDSKRNHGGTSDGESSVYAESWPTAGTMAFVLDSFDGQENGLFMPGGPQGSMIDVVIDRSVFGRTAPNGNNDGRAHDNYINAKSLTVKNSIYVGTSLGNTIKSRSADVTVTGNYIGRTNGRWIDLPGHTNFVSSGNTYVTQADTTSQNAIGAFDENDATNTIPGSFTSTNDTFCFVRFQEVIWNNDPAMVMNFVNPKLIWAGAAGATPPVIGFQGPGTVNGIRQLTAADRVDACPTPPADPTN